MREIGSLYIDPHDSIRHLCVRTPTQNTNRQWIGERAKIKAEEAVHPMLGQLISDLGYKKVYCASVVRTLHILVKSITGKLHPFGWLVDS